MQPTNFQTVVINPLGAESPTVIAKANKYPLRVLVHNVGPVVLFISDNVTDLVPLTLSAYRVFPDGETAFVVEQFQSLYCLSAAVGGLLSFSSSEALPLEDDNNRS